MINIRQSPLYAQFMRAIKWQVEEIDGVNIFIKKFPLLPAVAKIQRPDKLPDYNKLKHLMQKYGARSITIEPNIDCQLPTASAKGGSGPKAHRPLVEAFGRNCQLSPDPYIHTKTIHIDLTAPEIIIFNRFTEAKRRGVRRAQKNGVQVEISDNIDAFIKLKNRAAGFFLGFMTTRGFTKPLWNTFAPKYAKVLLAYIDNCHCEDPPTGGDEAISKAGKSEIAAAPIKSWPRNDNQQRSKEYIAGILLLWYGKTAYYWMAAASREGKKSFAPTLLVWKALKFAKKQGCTIFDFEGVFDERYPKQSSDWKGFSIFKSGFGGKPIFYPQPFLIK